MLQVVVVRGKLVDFWQLGRWVVERFGLATIGFIELC